MNHRILLIELPVKRHRILIMIPETIKPNGANRAVVGEQFRKLIVHELIIMRPVGFGRIASGMMSGAAPRIIFARPIQMRIVEMQTDALLLTSSRELFEHIAVEWRCIHNIII